MPKKVDLFCITIATPILVGVYEDGKLIESITSDEKSSDALAIIFQSLLDKYELNSLCYVNGPGSFMAIKVTYIFLRSLSILKGVPLYAQDAFGFNGNAPVKAIGKQYFVKINDKIEIIRSQEPQHSEFKLPPVLDRQMFHENNAPLYVIGAV